MPRFSLLSLALLLVPLFPLPLAAQSEPAQPLLQVESVLKESDRSLSEANVLLQQGSQQLYKSQLQVALGSFQQAAEQYRQAGDRSGEATALLGQAETYLWLGQSAQVLEVAQQALAIYQAVGDRSGEAAALHFIGDAQLGLDQLDPAMEILQKALVVRREVADRQGEGWTLGLLGIGQIYKAEIADGLALLEQSLSILKETVEPDQQLQQQYRRAVILAWIGNSYRQQEEYEKANQYLQEALTLSQSIGNRSVEMLGQFFGGALLTNQEQMDEAVQAYQRAQALAVETGNQSSQAWTFHRIGEIYKQQELYPAALQAFQQALKIFQAIAEHKREAQTLDAIGYVYIAQKQFAEAREVFEKEIIVAQQIPDRSVELTAISGLGNSYIQQGIGLMRAGSYAEVIPIFEQAKQQWKRAQQFAKAHQQTESEQTAIEQILLAYDFIAYGFSYQQQYSQAIAVRRQALDILQSYRDRLPEEKFLEEQLDFLGQLGINYFENSQYAASITAHQESAQIAARLADFAEQVRQLTFVADRYKRLNQYSQALEASQQALAITREKLPEDRESEMVVLIGIGQTYDNLGQYDAALEQHQQALTIAKEISDLSSECALLNNIGAVYSSQGEYLQALVFLQQAWQITQSAIQRLQTESESAVEQLCGKTTASLGTHGQKICLERYQDAATVTLNNLGAVYNDLGRYSEALEAYQKVVTYTRENKELYSEVTALGNLGVIYQNIGDYDRALELFQQSLQIAKQIDSRSHQAYALNSLGQIYDEHGQYPEALEFFQQALALAQEIGEPSIEANVLGNMGTIYDSQGKLSEALLKYQAALAIQQRLGESTNINLNNIAFIYQSQGRFAEALETYQQALEITKSTGKRSTEAIVISNIAGLYASQANYAKAIELQQQASDIQQQLGGNANQLSAQMGLGKVYFQIGQYEQALAVYQQALMLSRDMKAKPWEVTALSYIGGIYQAQDQFTPALDYLQQAMTLAQEMGDVIGESRMKGRIAQIYQQQGKSDEAVMLLEQSLRTFRTVGVRPDQGKTLNSLGLAYASQGKTAEAIDALQQAIVIHRETGDRATEAEALANLGKVFAQQNQPEVAIAFYKQSINLTEQIRQGLRTLSRDQQESYATTITDRYRSLADLLISQKRLLEAEQVIELLRIQEIYEYTRSTVSSSGEVTFTPAEQAVRELYNNSLIAFAKTFADCNATASCSKEIYQQQTQLNEEWNAAVNELNAETAGRERQADDETALGLSSLSSTGSTIVEAQPDTVMIYPVVQNNRLSILWIAPGGISNAIQVEVDQKDIAIAVSQFRELMKGCEVSGCTRQADIQAIQTISQQLYGWLIPPQLEAELEQNNIKNLVFALDRFLRYVPMSALHDGQQYLIENYSISTVTAGAPNRNNPLPAADQISVLGLGLSESVPTDSSKGISQPFNALDNVPTELAAIIQPSGSASNTRSGVFHGRELLNQAFDRDSLRTATQHQILHIATHGAFDPISAFNSFLVLGTKEALTIADIQNYGVATFGKLSLVVLSACETALGEAERYRDGVIPDGKEITSIAQTFINAGADTIVASLWQVNDPATAALMHQFYTSLAVNTPDQPVTIAQALQTAQLSLLHGKTSDATLATRSDVIPGGVAITPHPGNPTATQYAHPYYWSAFTIIGDGL